MAVLWNLYRFRDRGDSDYFGAHAMICRVLATISGGFAIKPGALLLPKRLQATGFIMSPELPPKIFFFGLARSKTGQQVLKCTTAPPNNPFALKILKYEDYYPPTQSIKLTRAIFGRFLLFLARFFGAKLNNSVENSLWEWVHSI